MAHFDSMLRGWNDRLTSDATKSFIENRVNFGVLCSRSRINEVHRYENMICYFNAPCTTTAIRTNVHLNDGISMTLYGPDAYRQHYRNYKFSNIDGTFYLSTSNRINSQVLPYSNTFQQVSGDINYKYYQIDDYESDDYINTEIILDMREYFRINVQDYITYSDDDGTQKILITYNGITKTLSSSDVDITTKISANYMSVRDVYSGITYKLNFTGSSFEIGDSYETIEELDDDGNVINTYDAPIKNTGDIILRDAIDKEQFYLVQYNSSNSDDLITYLPLPVDNYYHSKKNMDFNTDFIIKPKVIQSPYIDYYNNNKNQKLKIYYNIGFTGTKVIYPAFRIIKNQRLSNFKFLNNKHNINYMNYETMRIIIYDDKFRQVCKIKFDETTTINFDFNNNWFEVLTGNLDFYNEQYYCTNDFAEPVRIPFTGSVYMMFDSIDDNPHLDLFQYYRYLEFDAEFDAHIINPRPNTELYMRPEFREPIRLGNINSIGHDYINSYKANTIGSGYHTGVVGMKLFKNNIYEYRLFTIDKDDIPNWIFEEFNFKEYITYNPPDYNTIKYYDSYIEFKFHEECDEYIISIIKYIQKYLRTKMFNMTFINDMKFEYTENFGDISLCVWQLPIASINDHPNYVDGVKSPMVSSIKCWTSHGKHSNFNHIRSHIKHSDVFLDVDYWVNYTKMYSGRPTREFRYSGFTNPTYCGSRSPYCEIPSHSYAYKIKDGTVCNIQYSTPNYCSNPCYSYSGYYYYSYAYKVAYRTFNNTQFQGVMYKDIEELVLVNNAQGADKTLNNTYLQTYLEYNNINYDKDAKSLAIPEAIELAGKRLPINVESNNFDEIDIRVKIPFNYVNTNSEREYFAISFIDQNIYKDIMVAKISVLYTIIKGLHTDIMYFDNYDDIVSIKDNMKVIDNKDDYIYTEVPLITYTGRYFDNKNLLLKINLGHKGSIDLDDKYERAFTTKDKKAVIKANNTPTGYDNLIDPSDSLLNGSRNYDYYSEFPDYNIINLSEYKPDYQHQIVKE